MRIRFCLSLYLLSLVLLLPPVGMAAPFPALGKVASIIVPYPAGGGNDVALRALLPYLEKNLDLKLQVVNRAGAGSQVGMTELAKAKPDGYTMGYPLWPALTTVYLDKARKATFNRKSFEAVALHMVDAGVIVVKGDSPYHNLRDLVEAAKKTPGQMKVTDHGLLNAEHLMWLDLEKLADISFAVGHFAGGGASKAALLGEHTNAAAGGFSPYAGEIKAGTLRLLAILDDVPFAYAPEVPTAKAQGFDIWACSIRGFVAPKGTPRPVMDVWAAAIKKAIADPEYQARLETLQQTTRFMGPDEFGAYWDKLDADITAKWTAASERVRNKQQ